MNALDGRFAARQLLGSREHQEDDFGLIEPSNTGTDHSVVLLLADGMGGHVGGATASTTVIRTFAELFHSTSGTTPERLRTCLNAANLAIKAAIAGNPTLDGMGTTLVAAVVTGEGLEWISVGDSPLWLFRKGTLQRLNADHSMAPALAKLAEEGRITAEEAATDSRRHALRSAIVGDEIPLVDVSTHPVALQKEDCILLGSDGLFTLNEEELTAILNRTIRSNENVVAEVTDALVQAVEDAGHPRQDNTTVLLYAPQVDTKPVRFGVSKHKKPVAVAATGVLVVSLAVIGTMLAEGVGMGWLGNWGYSSRSVSDSDATEATIGPFEAVEDTTNPVSDPFELAEEPIEVAEEPFEVAAEPIEASKDTTEMVSDTVEAASEAAAETASESGMPDSIEAAADSIEVVADTITSISGDTDVLAVDPVEAATDTIQVVPDQGEAAAKPIQVTTDTTTAASDSSIAEQDVDINENSSAEPDEQPQSEATAGTTGRPSDEASVESSKPDP